MYTCHTHGWRSEEVPCPSCQETITLVEPVDTADPGNQSYPSVDSTGEQYAAQAKEGQPFEKFPELAKTIEWFANNVPVPCTQWNNLLRGINEAIAGAQSSLQPVDELAIEAMDFYWRHLMNELGKENLGDIERENYENLAAKLRAKIIKNK